MILPSFFISGKYPPESTTTFILESLEELQIPVDFHSDISLEVRLKLNDPILQS